MKSTVLNYRLFLALLLIAPCALPAFAAKKKPHYTKPPNNGGVYVAAHRGAHNDIPENTLAAYQKAIDLGCDFVEIDVRTSKDGHYVSVHNHDISSYVEGSTALVKDLTLAELRALDIGIKHGEQWKGTQIPTFEEILALCKGKIGIYLDLKDAPVADLITIIKEYDMEAQIIWYASASQHEEIARLSKKCVSMPDPGPEKNLPRLIERLHPTAIASSWRHYSESFVKTCHDAGAIVIVDESDPTCWDDCLAWGSDGIQTDHPAQLIEYLKKREK